MRSNRSAQSFAVAQRAMLRLTRGLSMHTSWVLRSGPNASVITIGAGFGCDWQIRAPGVASHALSIGFIDGELCAAAGSDATVSVGDEQLPEAWTKLPDQAALQLGAAQLELSRSELGCEDPSAEVNRATLPDAQAGDAAPDAPSDDVWSASLLGARAQPAQGFTLVRVAGFLLLMAASYFAWLVLLDSV